MTRRAKGEIIAAALTGALHPLFADVLNLRAVFIVGALTGWGAYFWCNVRRNPRILAEWGFGTHRLRACTVSASLVLACGMGFMLLWKPSTVPLFHPHMIPLLLLYPLWGLLQQWLVQAFFVRNLNPLGLPAGRTVLVCIAAAVVFASVHVPDPKLMAATFALGLCCSAIYQRSRNLWPLGFCHGWLGVLFYFWILGRDPWSEIVG
jgi:hypothetical protein